MQKRKSKFRLPAIGGVLATLGGMAVALATDPTIIATAAGKLGVSAVLLGSVVQAVVKPLKREDHER